MIITHGKAERINTYKILHISIRDIYNLENIIL